MDRKLWTRVFAKYGRQEAIDFFLKYKEELDFDIISGPSEGLVMVKTREHAKNTLFYMGEVLITETKIRHGSVVGTGLVKGSDNELSQAMAFIDLSIKMEQFTTELNEILNTLKNVEANDIAEKTEKILQTKVSFEMMND
ncbi:Alpha-D-ribose 1-methylphosphonate 5-triphosphate synthase subunit PhnG [Jeotgalicoccus aerolatus]|jgi:alpha-D-ribose 1-methylphosphonate 5-triphosphate synthase subunit PhnG|uniref:Alpha-D-ribose 1-methylphosphonate 5-triphosphate synthase subunit PhnG n=1 Tax=Jeotgalicoccus aerolatus TaxID=709510 RepID=A0ABS4HPN3_9STAP|nr:phosphonate C-P lyase system protein PhnG [Jeotgalicoccus aerolatus]MBP1952886.1 alpha-D-ribose 1-methylphosphonate 5-triphosphate synthase subunit PhnG [Jeotgalicoccus aerolatus]GGE07225.1 phosphonate C-P lyase system protein PhnG [Jeotgalicoccus aerolatus]CAD2080334.1 Alpha-D-ribose 1-methylphosphonate 5-triphosphate synthase subunit PhnG [Jeotgalicoccus aerolatus]